MRIFPRRRRNLDERDALRVQRSVGIRGVLGVVAVILLVVVAHDKVIKWDLVKLLKSAKSSVKFKTAFLNKLFKVSPVYCCRIYRFKVCLESGNAFEKFCGFSYGFFVYKLMKAAFCKHFSFNTAYFCYCCIGRKAFKHFHPSLTLQDLTALSQP